MFETVCAALSIWAIPSFVGVIVLTALLRGVKVYEVFVEGASEGFQTAVRILPFLLAMMVSVQVFRASGAMDQIIWWFQPITDFFQIPGELLPLGVMRPLSGTGTMGLATEMMRHFGADSFYGKTASVIMASSDTTFYILTVYFGAVGIKKVRYAPVVGLAGDFAAFLGAVYLCRVLFG